MCGRVCPQESQCEATCVVGAKFKPVAIGRLERFVADAAMGRGWDEPPPKPPTARKSAPPSSARGPAGLACAGELARNGVEVTIFEALHVAGGVLKYGIPEFRLPDVIIDAEIENLKKMGVEIRLDTIIGKLFTIPQLLTEMGYDAAFVGTGAGSPKFVGIPGEALQRRLLGQRIPDPRQPDARLPAAALRHAGGHGQARGGGRRRQYRHGFLPRGHAHGRRNGDGGLPPFAPRIARARRGTGARHRRGHRVPVADQPGGDPGRFRRAGSPACAARRWSWASRMLPGGAARCRWRAREFLIDVDTVIYALGTTANPIIAQTTPGLKTNKWGYIEIDERTGMTSIPGVFAGGDIVTGAATVILAMGAGQARRAGHAGIHGHSTPDAPQELAPAGRD